ncbi:ABC transporter permease [Mycoplasma simbae]|uniref:ABC transporter permease n=1 Tax=Mycoplasma simbae TaxID=36744 RepID=UPI000496CAE4|nr:ABC transporter permease [Mycoplasma simbae]
MRKLFDFIFKISVKRKAVLGTFIVFSVINVLTFFGMSVFMNVALDAREYSAILAQNMSIGIISSAVLVLTLISSFVVMYSFKNEGLEYVMYSKPFSRKTIFRAKFLASNAVALIYNTSFIVLVFILALIVIAIGNPALITSLLIKFVLSLILTPILVILINSIGAALSNVLTNKTFLIATILPWFALNFVAGILIGLTPIYDASVARVETGASKEAVLDKNTEISVDLNNEYKNNLIGGNTTYFLNDEKGTYYQYDTIAYNLNPLRYAVLITPSVYVYNFYNLAGGKSQKISFLEKADYTDFTFEVSHLGRETKYYKLAQNLDLDFTSVTNINKAFSESNGFRFADSPLSIFINDFNHLLNIDGERVLMLVTNNSVFASNSLPGYSNIEFIEKILEKNKYKEQIESDSSIISLQGVLATIKSEVEQQLLSSIKKNVNFDIQNDKLKEAKRIIIGSSSLGEVKAKLQAKLGDELSTYAQVNAMIERAQSFIQLYLEIKIGNEIAKAYGYQKLSDSIGLNELLYSEYEFEKAYKLTSINVLPWYVFLPLLGLLSYGFYTAGRKGYERKDFKS